MHDEVALQGGVKVKGKQARLCSRFVAVVLPPEGRVLCYHPTCVYGAARLEPAVGRTLGSKHAASAARLLCLRDPTMPQHLAT